MLERFLMDQRRDVSGEIGVLLRSVAEYPASAVIAACNAFKHGEIARDHRFPPNAVEFVIQVKRFLPPEPIDPEIGKYTGQIDADYGHGRIDMRRMTRAEVEMVDKDYKLQRLLANKPRPEIIMREGTMLEHKAANVPALRRM